MLIIVMIIAKIGVDALAQNTTGYGNIGIGQSGLASHTTGQHNIAIGFQSGGFVPPSPIP